MLKLTVVVLTVAFASTASAGGWRSLRIDGSGEDGFLKSVAAFQEELPPARRYVFERALQDIWLEGTRDAEAEQREYTATEYFRQLDGLRYKDVVELSDPSGVTARRRYEVASARFAPRVSPQKMPPEPPAPTGFSGEQVRGVDTQKQQMQERLADKGRLY
jgi:uncharacterized membrane protein